LEKFNSKYTFDEDICLGIYLDIKREPEENIIRLVRAISNNS